MFSWDNRVESTKIQATATTKTIMKFEECSYKHLHCECVLGVIAREKDAAR